MDESKYILDKLTSEEKVQFSSILKYIQDVRADTDSGAKIQEMVPIEEWVNSPYYAGPDCDRIYPYWKKALIDIFSSKVRINEVILSGAIGTGKSTCAIYIIVRILYELSCYNNIPAHFNLMASSLVTFLYFSLSKSQAELTGYGQIKNLIDSIPYCGDNVLDVLVEIFGDKAFEFCEIFSGKTVKVPKRTELYKNMLYVHIYAWIHAHGATAQNFSIAAKRFGKKVNSIKRIYECVDVALKSNVKDEIYNGGKDLEDE